MKPISAYLDKGLDELCREPGGKSREKHGVFCKTRKSLGKRTRHGAVSFTAETPFVKSPEFLICLVLVILDRAFHEIYLLPWNE